MQTPPNPPAAMPAAPRLHVMLQRDPATQAWQADLEADGERRHFDTLAALLAWLARLEDAPPARGIR